MLKEMRKTASSWIIKILLSLIVIAFVFMGVGNYRSQEASRIGTVNGEAVTIDEYRTVYRDIVDRMRQQFGNNLNSELIEMLQVKKQALDRVIGEKLVLQEAEKLGLKVTDEELSDAIGKIDVFKENAQFSPSRYEQVLKRVSLTPESFELRQRNAMLAGKMQALITDNVNVSEKEAKEWFWWQETQVNIDMAWFKHSRYSDVAPTEEELKAYYDANREKYKTEPSRKVQYVRFLRDDYLDGVVAEEDIKIYYEENIDRFRRPKTVEARHILLKVSEDADEATVGQVEAKAKEIASQARQEGQDFAVLAKEFSEGPTRDKGGYLGAFKKEDMVRPFSNNAFAMAEGEISDPVRTRFGWHVIKVEKINEATTTSFEEAKADIGKTLLEEKAKNDAYDAAEAVYEISLDGDDLLQASEEKNAKLVSVDYFTRTGVVKEVADTRTFIDAAFGLEKDEISDLIEMADGYYIMQVLDIKPAVPADYEEALARVKGDLKRELQEGKASADADQFLTAVAGGADFATKLEAYGLKPLSSGFFKRNDAIPGVGRESEVNTAAFGLTEEQPLVGNVIKGAQGYYVIRLQSRKTPEEVSFAAEKERVATSLLQQKKMNVLNDWIAGLREQGEVVIKEGLL